jgi:hypothetical protein
MYALGSVVPTRPTSERTVNSPANARFAAKIRRRVTNRSGSPGGGSRDAVSSKVSAMRGFSFSGRNPLSPQPPLSTGRPASIQSCLPPS